MIMMVIGTPSLTHEKPQNKPPSTSRKYSFNKVFFSTDAFPNAALSAALDNSAGLSKDEHQVNVLFDKLQVLFLTKSATSANFYCFKSYPLPRWH